jgi:hypothetical protein
MPIIADIANWAAQQPLWASDAIRRLFVQGELTHSDVDDLTAMIKASFGIPDPENRAPVPLDGATVPQRASDTPPVSILGIVANKHINAIPTSNGITFAATGLTTVYGNNGAGKSGYARTLKKACRARKAEDIHPNVFNAADSHGPAQATFEWVAGTSNVSATWTDGTPSPEALSRIAVFDSHCARVFVDDQAAVSYIPYGLEILRDFASGLQLIQRRVDAEAAGKKFDASLLDPLRSETEVGRLVAGLKHSSAFAPFESLATLTQEEADEKATLTKLLGDE